MHFLDDERFNLRLNENPRLNEEARTLQAMVRDYCHAHHGTKGEPCEACQVLLTYCLNRLARCPYQEKKPVCNRCETHCYKSPFKEETRAIMRYSGPRLLLSHPLLALKHLWYEKRIAPPKRKRNPMAQARDVRARRVRL